MNDFPSPFTSDHIENHSNGETVVTGSDDGTCLVFKA